jgi:polyhydroxyalkanoate synthesis regulator phasin
MSVMSTHTHTVHNTDDVTLLKEHINHMEENFDELERRMENNIATAIGDMEQKVTAKQDKQIDKLSNRIDSVKKGIEYA